MDGVVVVAGVFPAGSVVTLTKVDSEAVRRSEGGEQIGKRLVDDEGNVGWKDLEVGAQYLVDGYVEGYFTTVRAKGVDITEPSNDLSQPPIGNTPALIGTQEAPATVVPPAAPEAELEVGLPEGVHTDVAVADDLFLKLSDTAELGGYVLADVQAPIAGEAADGTPAGAAPLYHWTGEGEAPLGVVDGVASWEHYEGPTEAVPTIAPAPAPEAEVPQADTSSAPDPAAANAPVEQEADPTAAAADSSTAASPDAAVDPSASAPSADAPPAEGDAAQEAAVAAAGNPASIPASSDPAPAQSDAPPPGPTPTASESSGTGDQAGGAVEQGSPAPTDGGQAAADTPASDAAAAPPAADAAAAADPATTGDAAAAPDSAMVPAAASADQPAGTSDAWNALVAQAETLGVADASSLDDAALRAAITEHNATPVA